MRITTEPQNPGANPIGAGVRKPYSSVQITASNSSGQALSRVEGAGAIISGRKEKQQILQQARHPYFSLSE